MISSTLFSFVAAVSSLVAVNGAVFQRWTVNCDGVQDWQDGFAYVKGDEVIYKNELYTAKQWTDNNIPSECPDKWTLKGVCAEPVQNGADCVGIPAWQKDAAYVSGDEVTCEDHLWIAVKWTEGKVPGGNSGDWEDGGQCEKN